MQERKPGKDPHGFRTCKVYVYRRVYSTVIISYFGTSDFIITQPIR